MCDTSSRAIITGDAFFIFFLRIIMTNDTIIIIVIVISISGIYLSIYIPIHNSEYNAM